jgi:hypothetical protein
VGVSVLWSALLFVRSMGGLCEASVAAGDEFYRLPLPEPAARVLVKLRKSVEAGETGKFLESLDVMPPEFYHMLDRMGQLYANPEALQKFLSYPDIRAVLANTRFAELTQDAEIQDLARSQDTAALIRNPRMLAAVNDPGLIEKLQKIDIEKAFDYALGTPTPTPHPQTSRP